MIKINNNEYNFGEFDISWGNFYVKSCGQEKTGIAPRITFSVDNISILLELTFSKDMFEETKIGVKTEISNYISDILYEDKNGWLSLNDGKYDCFITRINDKRFHIDFNISVHDLDDVYNIVINDDIDLL